MNKTLCSLFLGAALCSLVSSQSTSCRGARTTQFRDNRGVSHNYLFSWENGPTSNLNLDWDGAQKICREHCMDLVSIETGGENDFIKQRIASGAVKYIWTSGRRNPGFDLVNSWYWAGSGARIGPTNNRANGDWSHTGGAKKPQPDNRENTPGDFGYRGYEEHCLSFLNNFYQDGIRWHDVACYHTKPFVCESQ
ncbi:L-selectin [Folsomia candida]|uniref:L-selectin n=1 Tax=Folsomia candida TaxID=158441 RepID=A0A226DI34_FOLCA|nr:L-selectin [Folsomia candida]OXA44494.1 L-selectin [Folsomia candida]